MTVQINRPDERYKSESECSPEELALIDQWFKVSHPTNHPKDRASVWWRFDPKYGAILAS